VLAVLVMFTFVLYIPGWLLLILQTTSDSLDVATQETYVVFCVLLWMLLPMTNGIAFLFCRKDIRKHAAKMVGC
jgi:hypothetical protein